MPALKRSLVLLSMTLLIAGCGSFSSSRKPTPISPMVSGHNLRTDSRQSRKRREYQEALQSAADLLGSNHLDDALRSARRARRLQPKNPDPYTLIAVIESRRGRETIAGNIYRKAFDLAPQRGDVLNNYGAWLCSNGYPAEALVLFDRALRDASYDSRADAVANAGGCALNAGQIERAEQDLKQALELDPNNAYALESMARFEAAHQRWFDARAFYQRRLDAAPASAPLLQLAIEVEQQLGNERLVQLYQQRLQEEFAFSQPAQSVETQAPPTPVEAPPSPHLAEFADDSPDTMMDIQIDDPTTQDTTP